MSNLVLAGPNYADYYVLASGVSWLAKMPLTNCQASARSIARTTTTTGTITVDFYGASWDVGVLCLWRTAAASGATISAEIYSGAGLSGTLLYSGNLTRRNFRHEAGFVQWYSVILPNNITAGSVRFSFSDASASVFDLSRLFAGPIWRAPSGENFDYGDGLLPLSDSVITRAADGSLRTLPGPAYREMTLSLSALSAESRAEVKTILEYGGDIFMSAYPDDAGLVTEHEMMCRLKPGRGRGSVAAGWWFERLTLTEL